MFVFVSNFVSPHTLPFCAALAAHYSRVICINMMLLSDERRRMGYDIQDSRVEIIQYSDDPQQCQTLIDNARAVMLCGAQFSLVANRIRQNKPVYIAHERIFKKGIIKLLDPRTWKMIRFCLSVRNKPVYLLAIGDNSARDFRRMGFCKDRIFRFGYFPAVKTYSAQQLARPDGCCRILWVGRFVDFKRPIFALRAFRKLGPEFCLTMAGDGALLERAKKYSLRHRLDVTFLGNIPAHQVEQEMLNAHILLSTSHKGEGWGAVINEGMNRGCAVVCAREIGCAGSLATEQTCVLFRTHSQKDLIRGILRAQKEQAALGAQAYRFVTEQFHADAAARRFAEFSRSQQPYTEGLLSKFF